MKAAQPERSMSGNQPIQKATLIFLFPLWWYRYGRLQEWENFHKFSDRAKNLVPRRTPTVLYHEGVIRYMEGQVLHLQKQIEERSENAQDKGVEMLKVRPVSASQYKSPS
jgi:adenylate cyclase 10